MAWVQDGIPSNARTFQNSPINRGTLRTVETFRAANAQYILDRVGEYLDWFRGDSIHIGGDETGNTWSDDTAYLNLLYDGLKQLGFKDVYMWNDNAMVGGSNSPMWVVPNPKRYWRYSLRTFVQA